MKWSESLGYSHYSLLTNVFGCIVLEGSHAILGWPCFVGLQTLVLLIGSDFESDLI